MMQRWMAKQCSGGKMRSGSKIKKAVSSRKRPLVGMVNLVRQAPFAGANRIRF
jgi:hypothetical protein